MGIKATAHEMLSDEMQIYNLFRLGAEKYPRRTNG